HRNLFLFPEEKKAPVIPARMVAAPALTPASVVAMPARAIPSFPYRYIGTFGSVANPIAVFAGDGAVITARAGDRVADRYKLASIGPESAEIIWDDGGGGLALQIPLGH